MAENTGLSQLTAFVDFEKYKKVKQLGKGGFGLVHLYELNEGEEVPHHGVTRMAVKKLISGNDAKKKLKVGKEVNIMCKLQHRNIVQYLGFHDGGDDLLIMLEYMPGGSIRDELRRSGTFSEEKTKRYTRDILEGLCYLHDGTKKKRIIHRDIKGDNVLLDREDASKNGEGMAKLADFGLSKIMETNKSAHTFGGTYYYMSPEMMKTKFDEKGHGVKTDIWSIGCVVVEMISSYPPWKGHKPNFHLMQLIAACEHPEYTLPDGVSQEAKDFIQKCFIIEPVDRPSAEDLLRDRFLTGKA